MSAESQAQNTGSIGTLVLFGLVGALYIVMLANISFSAGGGEASFSQAIGAFFAVIALWVALAVLLLVCGLLGGMPRWSVVAACILIPVSGVAVFVAIDMCSRHIGSAVIVPILLPLLVASYAAWARWQKFHAALPAKQAGLIVWITILVISIVTFLSAL